MGSLARLNGLSAGAAQEAFLRCCGSTRWARTMSEGRPYADENALFEAARRAGQALGRGDWLEAFAAHPRIGDKARGWAAGEQAGAAGAADAVLDALAEGNAAYEARFGHIFIVCATGKTAGEMLELLRSRLPNDPADEWKVAAAEQAKITRLRVEKLIA